MPKRKIQNLDLDVLRIIQGNFTNKNNVNSFRRALPTLRQSNHPIHNNNIAKLKQNINTAKSSLSRKIYNRLKIIYPNLYINNNANNNNNKTYSFNEANENGEIAIYANQVIDRIIFPHGYRSLKEVSNLDILRKVLKELRNENNPRDLKQLTLFNSKELSNLTSLRFSHSKRKKLENYHAKLFAESILR